MRLTCEGITGKLVTLQQYTSLCNDVCIAMLCLVIIFMLVLTFHRRPIAFYSVNGGHSSAAHQILLQLYKKSGMIHSIP